MEADRLTLRPREFKIEAVIHYVLSVLLYKAQANDLSLFCIMTTHAILILSAIRAE